jgi:hypothetical protein
MTQWAPVPEAILREGHWLPELSGMFSVVVVAAQRINAKSV